MSRTINFYNMAIYKNDNKTNIDLIDLIDSIEQISWENRVRKIDNDITASFPLILRDNYPEKRIIPFGKFRVNYKPFIGSITTSKLQAIKNDVVEMVTMVYDKNYRCAVIDYNMHGLKQKGIELYLSSFLCNNDRENWEVKLTPINVEKGINDIKKSNQIKCLEIVLKLDKNSEEVFKEGVKTDYKYVLDLFNNLLKTSKGTEANTVKIQLGVGNERNSTMNLETVQYVLSVLNIESDKIDSIKVRYRDDSSEKLDTINLKYIGKQLQDKILNENSDANPSPEFIGDSILEAYKNYDQSLTQQYIKFIEGMASEELPKIQSIPKPENQVDN